MRKPSLFITIFVFCSIAFLELFGHTAVYASMQSCLNDSGGREEIESVQQACQWYSDAGLSGYASDGSWGNYCALWLGGSSSINPTIYVDSPSGTATIYYYGMCTVSGGADNASSVSVDYAGGSIGGKSVVARGTWGNPKSTPTTLDIARFISVADGSYNSSDGTAYWTDVSVNRCHSDGSSCSSMSERVTVVVRRHSETSVDYDYEYEYEYGYDYSNFEVEGNSYLGSVTNVISGIKPGVYESIASNNTATFTHTLKQSNVEDYSTNISFGLDGSLGHNGTLNSGLTYAYNYNDNTKTVSPALSVSDSYSEPCQYISFKAKSWKIEYEYEYKYRHDYKIITTEEYAGNTLISTNSEVIDLGRELIDVNVTSSLSNSGNTGNSIAACAKIHRPWNFKISSIESQGDSDTIAYAGERASVRNFEINVDKGNDNYFITDIPNATIKLIGYTVAPNNSNYEVAGSYNVGNVESYYRSRVSVSNFYELSTTTNQIHKSGIDSNASYLYYTGIDHYSINSTPTSSVTVPDAIAGSKFCIALAVSPASSGNGYTSGFSSNWTVSDSYCYVVAKKPSFQVWGGGISARGSITASASNKNLFNINGAMVDAGGIISFGSWTEQESRTTGLTQLLSTGAATGNNENYINGVKVGGSYEEALSFCKYRVPLSFANYSNATSLICSKNNMGMISVGYSGVTPSDMNKDALINYFISNANIDEARSYSGIVSLNNPNDYDIARSLDNREVHYTYGEENLTIASSTLANNITHIVEANNNITIAGNLSYAPSNYGNLSDIPKLIIYAKNIVIDCNVTRIDAILMADEKIDTCASIVDDDIVSPDINSRERSRQLTINGAIIAGKLNLTRTYGAATGVNSGTPAEIVNYDASTILWEQGFMRDTNRNSFTSVYQKEIAPRH